MALDKDEGVVKVHFTLAVRERPCFARGVEDQSSGKFNLHHHAVNRSTNQLTPSVSLGTESVCRDRKRSEAESFEHRSH